MIFFKTFDCIHPDILRTFNKFLTVAYFIFSLTVIITLTTVYQSITILRLCRKTLYIIKIKTTNCLILMLLLNIILLQLNTILKIY